MFVYSDTDSAFIEFYDKWESLLNVWLQCDYVIIGRNSEDY